MLKYKSSEPPAKCGRDKSHPGVKNMINNSSEVQRKLETAACVSKLCDTLSKHPRPW